MVAIRDSHTGSKSDSLGEAISGPVDWAEANSWGRRGFTSSPGMVEEVKQHRAAGGYSRGSNGGDLKED